MSTAKELSTPRDPWLRVATLAGVATLPLALAGSVLSDPAGGANLNPGSPDAELLEVFVDYRGRQLVAASLFAAAAAAQLVFLGPLWARVRTGSEWLAMVAVAGGVAAAVLWVAIGAGGALASAVAADYNDADAARFLMVYGWEIARVTVAPYLVMVAAATVAGVQHHVFGSRFNIFGAGFSALLVLGLFPASPAGLMGMVATVWVLVASLVLAFGKDPGPGRVHEG